MCVTAICEEVDMVCFGTLLQNLSKGNVSSVVWDCTHPSNERRQYVQSYCQS